MVIEVQIQALDRQHESDIILRAAPQMVELVGTVAVTEVQPPKTFTLGSLRDGRLRVSDPIEVTQMVVEGGKYVIEATELNEFGFGNNHSEAIQDLQAAIAELYLTLEAEQGRLGLDLVAVWGVISQKVRKADAASCS
jgi:hypothetical protein